MKVAIRVDASLDIGTGHVMRCLALAYALKANGMKVTFYCRLHEGNMIQRIQKEGFSVVKMPLLQDSGKLNGYEHWLGSSEEQDAKAFIAQLPQDVSTVIVDHYGISHIWEKLVRAHVDKIAVIDDLADRNHDCDILIDQNLWPDIDTRYNHLVPDHCIKLLGPEYALLRNSFSELRAERKKKDDLLITFFGGADPTGESQKVVKALSTFETLPFDVIVIYGANEQLKTSSYINQLPSLVQLVPSIPNFDQVLSRAKYVIGASGISNWERFCLNVNASLVAVADNQIQLAKHLGEIGAANFLGEARNIDSSDYIKEFNSLINHWSNIEKNILIEVDGLGAMKVAKKVGF